MTEEVFDFLHSLQHARRRGRRTKVKDLSFEAWSEIKANCWASFTTKAFKEIRGTSRLAYARCLDGYVYLNRKGVFAVWDWLENYTALAILKRMGHGHSDNRQANV